MSMPAIAAVPVSSISVPIATIIPLPAVRVVAALSVVIGIRVAAIAGAIGVIAIIRVILLCLHDFLLRQWRVDVDFALQMVNR